jgi:hypothetical protein
MSNGTCDASAVTYIPCLKLLNFVYHESAYVPSRMRDLPEACVLFAAARILIEFAI